MTWLLLGLNPSGMSYRQFIPHGPQIPYDLVHALEDGRLVFFCGAGISIATGLPSFKGLVDGVLKEFAYSRTRKASPMTLFWRQCTRGRSTTRFSTFLRIEKARLVIFAVTYAND